MRVLPMESEHERLGARLGDVSGWRLPLHYGEPEAEQRAAREGAALVDWSARGKVRVVGEDRQEFLDGLLTNDVASLREGEGMYAASLDHKGRVRGDAVAYHAGDHFLLSTEPSTEGSLLEHLGKRLVSEDVTLEDVTASYVLLAVFGPDALQILREAGVEAAPAEPYRHAILSGGLRVARNPYFGIEGRELWIPSGPAASDVLRALVAAGATPTGRLAEEALRIESGRPRFGVDMDGGTIVLEAALRDAISFTKGCYLGQEVVSRATHIGRVRRLLVGLEGEGAVPPSGAPVAVGGRTVGRVTSAARSVALSRTVALAYLPREHADPGTPVTILTRPESAARVAGLPFTPPGPGGSRSP